MIEGQEKAIKQLQQDIQGIQAQATEERKLMQKQIDELKRMQQHAPMRYRAPASAGRRRDQTHP
ncbi:hypothetical protein FOMG_18722 [Fusarium oxysporum f. sp. melonis 26406]|uniref:Uncharacterized protein n=1 Tax=Fusarium oxysporum f. sp. melonis 26406 TaxID=1089452 RepID=W9ZU02_FUSOX|nr:hypothetical protein FOMG_18722 [Fusarium oxysporum f. sp. melonis 26406]